MRRLRTASTRRLLTIVAVLVATVAAAGIAQAALTTASKPDAKPLDRALYDAVNAKPVEGVTARVKFTNDLLPSGSLPQGHGLAGADRGPGGAAVAVQRRQGGARTAVRRRRCAAGERRPALHALRRDDEVRLRRAAAAGRAGRADRAQAGPEPDPGRAGEARPGVDAFRRATVDDRGPADVHGADRAQGRRRAAGRRRAGVGRRAR